MSDNRNLDIEEQLSILFDDIDDAASTSADETKKAAEAALDSVDDAVESIKASETVSAAKEVLDDALTDVEKPEVKEQTVKAAEAEIEKMAGEVKNVVENVEDAAAQDAVFVEAEAAAKKEAEELQAKAQEVKKAAADDTKIRNDEYKGIDFDSFESVIGDDDDEDALIPDDLPDRPRSEREADDEFDDDDEEDEDEIGGKSTASKRSSGSSGRRSAQVKDTSEDRKKESAKFWIFTAIVALIVAGAVLFILWSRGIIGGGREATPSSSEPSSSSEAQTSSETEPTTEPTTETEPPTESEPEETESEEPSDEETDEVTAQTVLDNYSNLFMVTGTGTLNVREQPDTSARIIGTIDEYGGGDILEQAGEWFKVSSGGITGYVNGAYIAGSADVTDLIAEHAVQQVRINAENGVNIRRTPGDGEIIDQASNNSLWEYLGEEDGFYKIRYNDIEGYVSMDYSSLGWFLKEAERYYE